MNKAFKVFLVVTILLLSFSTMVLGEEPYRLGFGDVLSASIWADGYGGLQQSQLAVRPDGKVVLTYSVTQLDNYRLGPGDVINVSVWGADDLKSDVTIKSDGKVAFPLIGEMLVSGQTPAELTKNLTAKFKVYIKEPVVTVNVVKARSLSVLEEVQATGLTIEELRNSIQATIGKYIENPQITLTFVQYRTVRVYVLGEADKPGMYEITKSHNLLDAIGAAGGYTHFANKREIYVIRKATGQCIKVDLKKLLKKGDLSQNYELNEGDLVYINKNGLSFFNDILPIITTLYDIKVITD